MAYRELDDNGGATDLGGTPVVVLPMIAEAFSSPGTFVR